MSWHACNHAADASMYLLQFCGWHCIAFSMIPWCKWSLNAIRKLTSRFLHLNILMSVFVCSCKAYADLQVFHFSESKDKEESDAQDVNSHDDAAQDRTLQEGSLPAHAPDKKIS